MYLKYPFNILSEEIYYESTVLILHNMYSRLGGNICGE